MLIVAIVFISWSFEKNLVLSVALMIVLVFVLYYIAQFFIKDYLAGLLVKASKEYRIGDQISIEDTKGKIDRFAKTQLRIKNPEGENIYIPYSLLISKAKTVEQQTEKVNAYTFEIELPQRIDFDEDIEHLENYIQLLPWIHPMHKATVELIDESKNEYHLRLTIYTFDKKYYRKVEQSVKKYVAKENLPKK